MARSRAAHAAELLSIVSACERIRDCPSRDRALDLQGRDQEHRQSLCQGRLRGEAEGAWSARSIGYQSAVRGGSTHRTRRWSLCRLRNYV